MNTKMWPLVAALTMSLAVPASAQKSDRDVPPGGLARNEAEYVAQFQRADQNGGAVEQRKAGTTPLEREEESRRAERPRRRSRHRRSPAAKNTRRCVSLTRPAVAIAA
jgi:hypothetical protein